MTESSSASRLLRRSRDAERYVGRWAIQHDGPDPAFMPGNGIVSATGRVGHVNELMYDIHSRSYAGEVKNIRLNAQWLTWWVKIVSRSLDQGKDALLVVVPSNKPNVVEHNGKKWKIPNLHILTEERHAYLLACERELIERSE